MEAQSPFDSFGFHFSYTVYCWLLIITSANHLFWAINYHSLCARCLLYNKATILALQKSTAHTLLLRNWKQRHRPDWCWVQGTSSVRKHSVLNIQVSGHSIYTSPVSQQILESWRRKQKSLRHRKDICDWRWREERQMDAHTWGVWRSYWANIQALLLEQMTPWGRSSIDAVQGTEAVQRF